MRALNIVQEPMEIHRRDLPREQRRRRSTRSTPPCWPPRRSLASPSRSAERGRTATSRHCAGDRLSSPATAARRAYLITRPVAARRHPPASSRSARGAPADLRVRLARHDHDRIPLHAHRRDVQGPDRRGGPASRVVAEPAHPYTRQLVAARLPIDPRQRFKPLGAVVARADQQDSGCPFYSRCPIAVDACASSAIPFVDLGHGHRAACLRVGEDPAASNSNGSDDRKGINGQ